MKLLPILLATLALAVACGEAVAPRAGSLLAVGENAPDVTLRRLDGQALPLSSLRGRTVLLNFWFHG